jgi:uncharacterized protein (TIGR02452 family)
MARSLADFAHADLEYYAKVSQDYRRQVASRTKFYESGKAPQIVVRPAERALCQLSVEPGDSLEVAQRYLVEHPCVLNMASVHKPGGGWLMGATAQEETLCFRTELFLSLDCVRAEAYPLGGTRAVYSGDVIAFRDRALNFLVPREQYLVSFVSVAALNRPKLIHGCLSPADGAVMREKVRTILRVAHAHGHSTVILGAFGCGAYGNPPLQTAGIFRDVLQEDEFSGAFRRIVFAILDGPGEDNYGVFRRTLAG